VKPCPKCGCPDELSLDSSRDAEASWIECGWCEYRVQKRCDEETLVEKWDALSRKKMPAFDLDVELAKLDAAARSGKQGGSDEA
jgi:hypothetical protein